MRPSEKRRHIAWVPCSDTVPIRTTNITGKGLGFCAKLCHYLDELHSAKKPLSTS